MVLGACNAIAFNLGPYQDDSLDSRGEKRLLRSSSSSVFNSSCLVKNINSCKQIDAF